MKTKIRSSKNWLISDLAPIRSLVVCLWLFMVSIIYTQAQVPELWGMTSEGGAYNNGVIFKTDLNGNNQQVVYSFQNDGFDPRNSLVQANNGMLYGVTNQGGAFNKGVLFEFNPITEVYTKKIDFNGTNGFSGGDGLIQSSNGKLYGIAGGGANGLGVLFEYDVTNSTLAVKVNFDVSIGRYPIGKLLEANNGKLYGMTTNGGTHDEGVLFEYDPVANTIFKKVDFNGTNGSMPNAGLMQASNGKLYGTTFYGGVNYDGVLFEYDILSNSLIKLFDFGGNAGYWLSCALIEAGNGKLYGGTHYGGLYGSGTLFEFDPSLDTLYKIFDLNNNTTGEVFAGTFVQASNGKLYGMTFTGGVNNKGVLFELNPADNSIQERVYFNGSNGAYPRQPGLIEIQLTCSTTIDSVSAEACFSYTSPSGKYTWTASGTYTDSTTSIWGCDSILIINLTIRDSADCVIDTSAQSCLSIVSDNTWSKSSVITPTNLSGYWNGVAGLPTAATFTEGVALGQPYGYPSINPIQNTDVISTGRAITYFRKAFPLSNVGKLSTRMLITVDDQAEIYLNGYRVALISQFGRANFKFPAHDVKFIYGTSSNGYLGGDAFDVVTSADLDTVLKPGINELIVAVRNLDKADDLGGFSFRMDINCEDNIITQKSTEATAPISEGLFIFPNPAAEVLNVQSELAISGIQLFDLSGKLIYSADLAAEKHVELGTADLAKGVYLIRVEEVGGQISTFKIIKE